MRRRIGGTTVLAAAIWAIGVLGPAAGTALAEDYPPEWATLDVPGLTTLAGQLTDAGNTEQVQLLASYVAERYATVSGTGGVDWPAWLPLVTLLGAEFDIATRETMILSLQQAMLPSNEAVKELTFDGLKTTWRALAALGAGSDLARGAAATWVTTSDKYKALGPQPLADVAVFVGGEGELVRPAQAVLVEHITGRFLTDPAAVRSFTLKEWSALAANLRGGFTRDGYAPWVEKLRGAFAATTEAVASLGAGEFASLASALTALRDRECGKLVVAWVDNSASWTEGTTGDLAAIAACLAGVDKASMARVLADLESVWEARNQKSPLPWRDCDAISRAWRHAGDLAKTQAWALRAYQGALGTEEARAAADCHVLVGISEMLSRALLPNSGQTFTAFSQVLVSLAKRGDLGSDVEPDDLRSLARTVGASRASQVVEEALVGSEGAPRLAIAKILAWVHHDSGAARSWLTRIDAQIAAAGGSRDLQAAWLLAKAYTEALVPAERNPLRARRWLDAALSAATSESTRLAVLGEFVDYYRDIGAPEVGVSMLASLEHRFTDDALSVVVGWRLALEREVRAHDVEHECAQAARFAALQQARLQYYRECLARAKARRDDKAIAKLEEAIAGLVTASNSQ